MRTEEIVITDAYENNLKHISLRIPKHCLTVFTGVSGSGKSSLVLDTVAAQSRRELNETFPAFVQNYLPKYGRPHVGAVENLPAAIVIDQKKPAMNQRSTVGTYTDTYTLMRLLFSRIGKPFAGYSDVFSFNHPQGSCPRCEGIGEITELDVHKLVDFDKCLNDPGVINYVAFEPGQWRWIRYAASGLFDLNKKIRDYSAEELELFLNSPQIRLKNPPEGWPKTAKYEGLVHRMYRSVLNSEEGKLHRQYLDPMTRRIPCPECGGTRLAKRILACRINGLNIAQASALAITDLKEWLFQIDDPLAEDLKRTLGARLDALIEIGLGYLSLNRPLGTLSGGEAQRCKIAKYLNSSLCDLLYILDEPSTGLHSHDIRRMTAAVKKLRDRGNTVLLVEHHAEMIREADHVVDLGPGAGNAGGSILFEGSYEELIRSGTQTGNLLKHRGALKPENEVRVPERFFSLEHISHHNLKDVSVRIPLGVMTVIAGVAGSGKSSLMEAFRSAFPEETVYISQRHIGVSLRSTPATYLDAADGIRRIFADRCVKQEDAPGAAGSRNPGTVRTKRTAEEVSPALFSFNGKGKCPVCQGKGVIISEMAFMDNIETVCEACGGLRYAKEVLSYRVDGKTIAEVMDFSADEAVEWLLGKGNSGTDEGRADRAECPAGASDGESGRKKPETPLCGAQGGQKKTEKRYALRQEEILLAEKLKPLQMVGLGYLHLNQALSTLSGGELQRMKLASYLQEKGKVFILDEPTDGLHMSDIGRLTALFSELTDRGNTMILIEHNLEVLKQADYVIELGPGGGEAGGRILFSGTPRGLCACVSSVTAPYLRNSAGEDCGTADSCTEGKVADELYPG